MTDIKRYDWKPEFGIVGRRNGPYVLHSDYVFALEKVRGEIAYALTKRLVIDMPTARSAVDDAFKALPDTAAHTTNT